MREHVGLAHQAMQGLDVLRLAQIETRRQLAVAGVVFLIAEIGRCAPVIFKHVGAVLGEGAGAGRAGQHAGQVEHADAG